MNLLSSLEKRFGEWAIPHLTLYLIVIQAVGAFLLITGYAKIEDFWLVGGLVRVGQWSRLFAFMMIPRTLSPYWLLFSFYVFYLIGSSLEQAWGIFRYNLFILTGYLLTVLASFLVPSSVITNTFFLGSVFLACATCFPNTEFSLFFILPVKAKWLGWATAVLYLFALFTSDLGTRFSILAAFLNYFIFFGGDFLRSLKAKKRRKAYQAQREVDAAMPIHRCVECGATDKNDPPLDFRYCSTCGKCFCEHHISNHSHDAES